MTNRIPEAALTAALTAARSADAYAADAAANAAYVATTAVLVRNRITPEHFAALTAPFNGVYDFDKEN